MADNEQKVFNQDLEQNPVPAGAVFIIHLLMEEPCEMPDKDFMVSVLNKHLGDVDCFSCDDTSAGFMAKRYNVHYEEENKNMPPMLMLTKACEIEKPVMNEMDISQTWNCPEAEEILASCKYQVFANDMMAAGLHYLERAEMLTDYVDALLEIYPTCKAVVFETSKKMYTRDELVNCNVAKEDKFIYYAVNVRFFNIQGTDDMIVDTVGMGTLFIISH